MNNTNYLAFIGLTIVGFMLLALTIIVENDINQDPDYYTTEIVTEVVENGIYTDKGSTLIINDLYDYDIGDTIYIGRYNESIKIKIK